MKNIDVNSALDLLEGRAGAWFFSLADWRFQAEWDGHIFEKIVIGKAIEIDGIGGQGDTAADLGFFEIPGDLDRDRLLSLLVHQATRCFICADVDFFSKISMSLAQAIGAPYNQLSDLEIRAFSSIAGYRCMLIRDGDEGDYFYYLFAGDAS